MIDKIPKVIALFETTLASAINATATTFTLTSGTDKDGNTLPAGTYGITIDEGNANEEFVVAEITETAGTNAKRGVSVSDGTTEVTALKKSHRRGASVKITNSPALVIISRVLRGEEEVDYEPTSAKHLATKEYVDDLAFGDVPEASETAVGFAEIATEDEAVAGTEDGSVGRLVLPASLATQTGGVAKRIPVTDTDGKLNSFVDTLPPSVVVAAGESVTGATTPQPVYIDTSDSKAYKVDANDNTKYKYVGLVTSSGSADADVTVALSGVVGGFTGLTVGSKYYATDTAGGISTTAGTQEILVGIAVSTTQLLIQKNTMRASGTTSFSADGTQTIEVGFRVSKVRISAALVSTQGQECEGGWTKNGGNRCLRNSNFARTIYTSAAYYLYNSGGNGHRGVIDTVTDTSFRINNTEIGEGVEGLLYWEAEGE